MIKRNEVKWFKDNGFLNEEGDHGVMHFKDGLQDILNMDEIRDLNVTELQTLKCDLLKMVGDAFSDVIAKKRIRAAKYENMTDEQFFKHLDTLHGGDRYWEVAVGALTNEEYERLPVSFLKSMEPLIQFDTKKKKK